MRESYKKIVNEDLSGCARQIQNKTLLIYGADDKTTPPDEEGATFSNLIANSELKIIKGGHFCFVESINEFNELMLKFLKEE